ncbi:ATP-dependent nuclease [Stenotrophomonas rhizophila]
MWAGILPLQREPDPVVPIAVMQQSATNVPATDKPPQLRSLHCLSLRGMALERHEDPDQLFRSGNDLQLQAVNLFAGPNGSGKTTVLDAVRSLFEPTLFSRLRRENIPSDGVSGVRIVLDNDAEVTARFYQSGKSMDPAYPHVWEWQHTRLCVTLPDGTRCTTHSNLPVHGKVDGGSVVSLRTTLDLLECVGAAWPDINAVAPGLDDYASVLSRFQRYLPHNPPDPVDGGRRGSLPGQLVADGDKLHQFHADDLRQSSRIAPEFLPSGWHHVVDLLSWLERCTDGAVCVIDEPERHLHPALQRALVAEVASMRRRKSLQLVIATHSPVFLDRSAWGRDHVALFHLSGGRAVREPELTDIIDGLGCRASDICQANGVVWVEGPSDRIYIKRFLNVWQAIHRPAQRPFAENLDYAFAFFGGSCLGHFSGARSQPGIPGDACGDLIELLSLNRNLAICMDRDDDFIVDDFGTLQPVTAHGSTKQRVALALDVHSGAMIHLTEGYTIECYVADAMPAGFITYTASRAGVNGNKVHHAQRFAALPESTVYDCLLQHSGLMSFVARLGSAIERWRHG